jgi:hypothetical protein
VIGQRIFFACGLIVASALIVHLAAPLSLSGEARSALR